MRIVLGADDRYALPMSVTISSALGNLSERAEANVLVVDGGISEDSRHRLERVVRVSHPGAAIEWMTPPIDRFRDMRTTHWGSPASYLPLLIPELLEDNDPVLYVDSDLLVQTSLEPLWEKATETDTPLHAVMDYGFHTLGEALKGDGCSQLGLDPNWPYFNSGVLLINVDAWRRDRVAERAIEFAKNHPDVMRFTDQDALNVALEGNWRQLDLRWNVLIGSVDLLADRRSRSDPERLEVRRSLLESPHILHFSGPQKPWKPGYERAGKREYLQELETNGWFDTVSEFKSWRRSIALKTPYAIAKRKTVSRLWPIVTRLREARGDQV